MSKNIPSVVIIGAGFGGLGLAMMLKRAGFAEFTVLEKADDLGGVWRDNTYPGAACDVPSPLYSYSFAPNRTWPHRYARQPDILAYLRRTAIDAGVLDHVRLGTEVTAATFDGRWRIETARGETFEADVLVPAVGQLSRPVLPDIPGADTFAGPAFHSARWDHEVDLAGKRIAVIGTGASAVQFVPHIQPGARRLTIFQRSAPYVVPKPDITYRPWHHRLFRTLPMSQSAGRAGIWLAGEALTLALTDAQPLGKLVELAFRAHLRRQVADPRLRARLIPDYRIGCKRLLFSNGWFPAISAPNVDLVTDPITELTPHGIRTAVGEHEADVIIYGTGFRATDFLAPIRIRGLGGRELDHEWAGGARAYLGMTVPGFPNMFLIYGPNTNLGGNSIISMMERQYRYILQVLARRMSYVDVREAVAGRFDAEVRKRLARSVWSGCASWYRDPDGRIPTNWPGLVWEYHRRTARVNPADFHLEPPTTP
ncbi:MAG TPA: NAD(P)/FAD-dependent oxidoreductase [Amycolatopsis sp.]|nr:NAD(P)/FAD-dependent oxidoreductase [Amycolatopsis sp.]